MLYLGFVCSMCVKVVLVFLLGMFDGVVGGLVIEDNGLKYEFCNVIFFVCEGDIVNVLMELMISFL